MRKNALFILSFFLIICLSACKGSGEPSAVIPGTTVVPETTAATIATEVPETTTVPAATEPTMLPLPGEPTEFSFLSGAGGWSTQLVLNTDGSFIGWFHDSEMGDIGEGYSNGTVYVCAFSGKFMEITKISDYAYMMTLSDVTMENQPGEEWIEDNIRYVAYDPYGIEEGKEFVFYLPDTPISEVPEGFLAWWPYRYDQSTDPKPTLSCYGILNTTTDYGFFYVE